MNSRRVRLGMIMVCVCFFTLNWVAHAEDSTLKGQIAQLLNLGREITVEKYQNGTDEIVLWTEALEGSAQVVKNWGLVFYEGGKPVDLWFYTGPLTNVFKRFSPSFHQFKKDGRKELAIVGEGLASTGWVDVFIFDFADKKVHFLFEGRSNNRGGTIFSDINGDKQEEIFLYQEIRGTLYWADIYSWNSKAFVLANNKNSGYFTTLARNLEKAAAEEEKLTTGNPRLFYEYLVRVYEIMNKPEQAAQFREKSKLPSDEIGNRVKNLVQVKGVKLHQIIRADLDGTEPIDAIIWAKSNDGLKNYIWLISQNGTLLFEPVAVPIPQAFFDGGIEIQFLCKDSQVLVYRKATAERPYIAYLFSYDRMKSVTLLGVEERNAGENGMIIRRVAGQFYNDPTLPAGKTTIIPLAFIQASQCQVKPLIDGMLTEREWQVSKAVPVDNIGQVIYGGESWEGSSDLSLGIQAVYSGNSLYLGIKVRDLNKVFMQKPGQEQNLTSDHLEILLEEKEKIYRYGIFNLSGETQVVEMSGKDVRKPTHPIKSAWIAAADGYTVEIEISGLTLTSEVYPLTVIASDTDDGFNPRVDTQIATSPYKAGNRHTLGLIKLQ